MRADIDHNEDSMDREPFEEPGAARPNRCESSAQPSGANRHGDGVSSGYSSPSETMYRKSPLPAGSSVSPGPSHSARSTPTPPGMNNAASVSQSSLTPLLTATLNAPPQSYNFDSSVRVKADLKELLSGHKKKHQISIASTTTNNNIDAKTKASATYGNECQVTKSLSQCESSMLGVGSTKSIVVSGIASSQSGLGSVSFSSTSSSTNRPYITTAKKTLPTSSQSAFYSTLIKQLRDTSSSEASRDQSMAAVNKPGSIKAILTNNQPNASVPLDVGRLSKKDKSGKQLPFTCPVCKKKFQRHIALNAHFQNEHISTPSSGNSGERSCKLCGHIGANIIEVRRHLVVSHNIDLDNPAKCDDSVGQSSSSTSFQQNAPIQKAPRMQAQINEFPPGSKLTSMLETSLRSGSAISLCLTGSNQINSNVESGSGLDVLCGASSMRKQRSPSPVQAPAPSSSPQGRVYKVNVEQATGERFANKGLKRYFADIAKTAPELSSEHKPTEGHGDHETESSENDESPAPKARRSHDDHNDESESASSSEMEASIEDQVEDLSLKKPNAGQAGKHEFDAAAPFSSRHFRPTPHGGHSLSLDKAQAKGGLDGSSEAKRPRLKEVPDRHQNEEGRETSQPPVGRFTCAHCSIVFPNQTLYFLHRGFHSDSNPWRCNACGTLSADLYDFNAHLYSVAHQ